MELIFILLVVGFMFVILGGLNAVLGNGIQLYCNWSEGNDIDWGSEIAYTFAGPFVFLFVLFEIYVLYWK